MADGEVSGTINVEVIYKEAGGSGVTPSDITGGGGGGGASGGGAAADKKKTSRVLSDMAKFAKITAGSLTIGAAVKNSKIASGFLGTMAQMLGALVDVFLMPFIPLLIPIMKVMAGLIKWLVRFMEDPGAAMKEAWNAFFPWLKEKWETFWENIQDTSQWGDFIPEINWENLLKMGVGGAGLIGLIAALGAGVSAATSLMGLGGGVAAAAAGGATIAGVLAAAGTVAVVAAAVVAVVATGITLGYVAHEAVKHLGPTWLRNLLGVENDEDKVEAVKKMVGSDSQIQVRRVLDSIIGWDAKDREEALWKVREQKTDEGKARIWKWLATFTADQFITQKNQRDTYGNGLLGTDKESQYISRIEDMNITIEIIPPQGTGLYDSGTEDGYSFRAAVLVETENRKWALDG
jgi:hypothetical protein